MLHALLGENREQVRDLVWKPLSDYLRSSMKLIAAAPAAGTDDGFDLNRIPAADKEFMVERSFNRYFGGAGLFGTVEDAREVVNRLTAIGVDEVACLIDFGVDADHVMQSLHHLDTLRAGVA